MKSQWKLHGLPWVVATLLVLGGLVSWPAHAYAAYNPPSGPVLTGELLLDPIESSTPHVFNPPNKP